MQTGLCTILGIIQGIIPCNVSFSTFFSTKYSSIGGAVDSSNTPKDETDVCKGLEGEDMWIECLPEQAHSVGLQYPLLRNKSKTTLALVKE